MKKQITYWLIACLVALATLGSSFSRVSANTNVNGPLSRIDAAVFIAEYLQLDTSSASKIVFTDVSDSQKAAVNAVVNADIMKGINSSQFKPNELLTRAQMSKILTQAFHLDNKATALPFKDVQKKDWFYSSVGALYSNGITAGKTKDRFAPSDFTTYRELSLFADRANPNKGVEQGVKFIEAKDITLKHMTLVVEQKASNPLLKGNQMSFRSTISNEVVQATVEWNTSKDEAFVTGSFKPNQTYIPSNLNGVNFYNQKITIPNYTMQKRGAGGFGYQTTYEDGMPHHLFHLRNYSYMTLLDDSYLTIGIGNGEDNQILLGKVHISKGSGHFDELMADFFVTPADLKPYANSKGMVYMTYGIQDKYGDYNGSYYVERAFGFNVNEHLTTGPPIN